jgi:Zn-dependent M28 family amino/carboxypeptidase
MRFTFFSSAILFSFLLLTGFSGSFVKKSSIKPDELKSWINFLSSDEMRGRANGSPEMNQCALWLSDKYKEYGLKPVFPDGKYIQSYTYTSRQRTVNERNIIGMIEGTDPKLKDQYIIISAHFDHLGIRKGNSPDSIYNGADDNAAGTCTLLGIAKNFKDSGMKPGRTILFTAFSGEESGTRGSRYFVANSPVPLAKAYANINFEMTGHSEYLGKNRYYMTGCKISNLDDLIGEYNKNSQWKLIDTIKIASSLFYSSDNISFSRISSVDKITSGIPSGTFATTTLADYIHTPKDESKLFDFDNMAGLVNYFSDLIVWLSKNKTEINFTDPSFVRIKK